MRKLTENHGVGGSIPPLGTTLMFSIVRQYSPSSTKTLNLQALLVIAERDRP
jgi:hypothetical protein